MSTTATTMTSTPVMNGRSEKPKNRSKVIILSMPSALLRRFSPKNESPSAASSPVDAMDDMSNVKPVSSQDNASESNSTPAPGQDAPTPGDGTKKKKASGAGVKRSLGQVNDGMPKPRGKPGPKKKPRLEDGTIDHSAKPVAAPGGAGAGAGGGAANHKLGPKANTGNINANLRALDRSGAPCRKWDKKGFQLKSFTGIVWQLSSWKGGDKSMLLHGSQDSKDVSMQDSSDLKPSESGTALGSNAGEHPDHMDISTPAARSPPPVSAPPSVAAHG